jgi:hypothetical protein
MSTRVRLEEYTALGDFIKESFERDQSTIVARKPKLDGAFLADFSNKLEAVKVLESGLVLTEEQKRTTVSLYEEATELNKKLNFLSSDMKDANLSSAAVTDLKTDLNKHNIEGAILKIESVKQFVVANTVILQEQGMDAGFVAELDAHKISLSAKNALQNKYMNDHKTLTDANRAEYKALYAYITRIATAGKLVFDRLVTKDEYTITKIVDRMRAAKRVAETAKTTS